MANKKRPVLVRLFPNSVVNSLRLDDTSAVLLSIENEDKNTSMTKVIADGDVKQPCPWKDGEDKLS